MNQKPIAYDENARCPGLRYLTEDLYMQDIPTMIDQMAYSYHRKNIIEFDSIAVLTGDGSNGKGVVTSILTELHGETVSNVPLDLMSDDKFAASHMVNKDINIDTEVRPKTMKDTTMLKKLTGSHPIWVQEKGEKGFDAFLHAKIWLSGNNLRITDGSGASDRRLRFISFKRKFEAKQAEKNLTEKLLAEAPGIFNMLMHNLRMLLKTKTIRVKEKDIDERIVKNAMVQDPIKYFIEEHTISVPDGHAPKDRDVDKKRVHNTFEHFCHRHGLPKTGYPSFCTTLHKQYYWDDRKKMKVEGDKEIHYRVWRTHMLKPQCVVCGIVEDDSTRFIDMLTHAKNIDEWVCKKCNDKKDIS